MDIVYKGLEWVEFYLPLISTVGNFLLIVTAAIVANHLSPSVAKWIANYKEREANNRKKVDALVKQHESKESSETDRRNATFAIWKIAFKGWWPVLASLGVLIVMMTWVVLMSTVYLPRAQQESHESRVLVASSHVNLVDESRKLLWYRVLDRRAKPEPPGEGHTQAEQRDYLLAYQSWLEEQVKQLRHQELCEQEAIVATESLPHPQKDHPRIRVTRSAFKACMLEEQWRTEHCSPEESGCDEIFYVETECTSLTRRWLREGNDIDFEPVRECLNLPVSQVPLIP